MKRLFIRLFFPVLAALFLLASPAFGEAPARKLTLMVYMCGSNLERLYGSATLDMQEMKEAALSRDVSVLVMTGGSDREGQGGYFQAERTGIYEIGLGRLRSVWSSEQALNMGDPDTLVTLLRYGQENRPAEKYALILWDHGGGPLEGVCWDETSGMDHLSLSELTEALLRADYPEKLSWIGFDACLMSSLEVAGQMAPYAEYMIASQETEPASGWNYSFLNGLEADADGGETGRRVVDAYFEGKEETGDILTLACTDLGAVQPVIDAMDPVFSSLEKNMGSEQFVALSGLRMSSTGFGKAGPGDSSTGYDLVDAADLVSRLDQTEDSEALLAAIKRAIVYSRANEEGANGLTIYHPYANKSGYQEKWKQAYQGLSFSPGYQQYIEAFGRILTGEAFFRWLNLIPRALPPEEDGRYGFELPLTEEQAEQVVSAQVLILRDSISNRLDQNCALLASCSAEVGEDHVVRGSWDGRCLYVESDRGGSLGPVSYLQTDDGKSNSVIGWYVTENQRIDAGQMVVFDLDPADQAEYPEIRRRRVWDDVTGSFSSRMAFTEEGYGTVLFYHYHRAMPEVSDDQVLPAYETWKENWDLMYAESLTLPDRWRFHMVREDSGRQYYAVFRLLDSQQNVICSLPAAVPFSHLIRIEPVSGSADDGLFHAELSCQIDLRPQGAPYSRMADSGSVQMDWTYQNKGTETLLCRIENLTVNGTRSAAKIYLSSIDPGETRTETAALGRFDLAGIDSLRTLSGEFIVGASYDSERSIPFSFVFEAFELPSFLRGAEPLAEGEADGIGIQVLDLEADDEFGWNVSLLVENGTPDAVQLSGLAMENSYENWLFDPLPAGMSRVMVFHYQNADFATSGLTVPGNPFYAMVYTDVGILQSLGLETVQNLTVFLEGSSVSLRLREPLTVGAVRWPEQQDLLVPVVRPPRELSILPDEKLPLLKDTDLYRVTLRRIIGGEDSVGLSLLLENKTDRWLQMTHGSHRINGQTAAGYLEHRFIPPHMSRIGLLILREGDAPFGPEIRNLEISLSEEETEAGESAEFCGLTPEEPVRLGQETWINGEKVTVAP